MFMAHTISRCSAKIVQSVAPRVVGSNSARLIRSSAAKEDPTALSTDSYERGVLKNRLAGLGLLPFMDVSNPGPDPVRSLMQIQSDLVNMHIRHNPHQIWI